MIKKETLINRAQNGVRESKTLDFKSHGSVNTTRRWCKLVRDIIAMGNTGGGCILFGANNRGEPTGNDVSQILDLDSARITDKIEKYTGLQFSDFEIIEIEKDDNQLAALLVYGVSTPIPFTRPGEYRGEDDRMKQVFAKGTVYFRHGAKSEPCCYNDLTDAINRNLESIREAWLSGIKKVVEAPKDSEVHILEPGVLDIGGEPGRSIRITDEEEAPAYKLATQTDDGYPYRQKEVIEEVNKRLGDEVVNSYDILSVRRVYDVDDTRPDFYYEPKYSPSAQYSEKFVEWLVDNYRQDSEFFEKTRDEFSSM